MPVVIALMCFVRAFISLFCGLIGKLSKRFLLARQTKSPGQSPGFLFIRRQLPPLGQPLQLGGACLGVLHPGLYLGFEHIQWQRAVFQQQGVEFTDIKVFTK